MKKLAVIFDLNGVLVDDEVVHEAAFAEALHADGMTLSIDDYSNYFWGRTDRAGLIAFLEGHGVPADPQRVSALAHDKAQYYQKLLMNELKPVKSGVELARRLHQDGYQLALVTGSNRDEALTVLRALDVEDLFQTIVTAEDTDESKPSPAPFLLAAERLGRRPEDCLVIEDSPSGIAAAQRAGMRSLGLSLRHGTTDLRAASAVTDDLSTLYGADAHLLAR